MQQGILGIVVISTRECWSMAVTRFGFVLGDLGRFQGSRGLFWIEYFNEDEVSA